MSPRPVCSVLIANYNGVGLIADCIESVLAQDCDFETEIIVHDDASTDGSADFIRRRYPQVALIASPGNVGFCVSNNRMAERARGKFLLLLNNDAALYPDALRTLREAASELGKPAILGLPQYDATSGALIDRGCLLDPFFNPVPNLDPTRRDVAMVIGACMWIPRTLWKELEGFPDWFGSIAEDMYLCCRARLTGCPVQVTTTSGYRHRVGWSFGGGKVTAELRLVTSVRRRALSERNKTFVMVACYPAPWLMLALPVHLLVLALEGAVLALLKRDAGLARDIYFACFLALWDYRRQLASLRKAVQAGAVIGFPAFLQVFRFLPYKLEMLLRHGLPEVKR